MLKVIIEENGKRILDADGDGAFAIIDKGATFGTLIHHMSIVRMAECMASSEGPVKDALGVSNALTGAKPRAHGGWGLPVTVGVVGGIVLSKLVAWLPTLLR